MSKFYFYDPKEKGEPTIYQLSCTTDISISSPAVATRSPVEDGSSLVDNYYIDNKTATYSGLITQIKVIGQEERTDTSIWISSIQSLRSSKKLLTLVAHTEILQNCLITQFTLSKNKEQGLTGWKCEIEFQEVDISERAKLVAIKEPKVEVKDEVTNKSKPSSSSTKDVELRTSFGVDIKDAVTG